MSPRARRRWLAAAAALGAAAAALQILHGLHAPLALSHAIAARVNGVDIEAASVERTLAGLTARDASSLKDARVHVLARMIDEELLVQHALDSGAAENDPEVRAALVRSAITRVNAEIAARPLSPEELSAYYARHREAYRVPARYEVTPLYFASPQFPRMDGAAKRAQAARQALGAGAPLERVQADTDALPFATPETLTRAHTLENYFGPTVMELIGRARPGELTAPARFARGLLVLHVDRKVEAQSPALESIRELVLADALRERQEQALEQLLGQLRSAGQVEIAGQDSAPAR